MEDQNADGRQARKLLTTEIDDPAGDEFMCWDKAAS